MRKQLVATLGWSLVVGAGIATGIWLGSLGADVPADAGLLRWTFLLTGGATFVVRGLIGVVREVAPARGDGAAAPSAPAPAPTGPAPLPPEPEPEPAAERRAPRKAPLQAAKRQPAKKTPAKKTPAKKTPAKKSAAKKQPPRKRSQ